MSSIGRTAGLAAGLLGAVAGFGLLALAPVACRADDGALGQAVVKIDLLNADLREAVSMLKTQAGAQILIEPSEKPYERVTLSLDNMPLDKVLKMIARAAGAEVHLEDGVYIVGPKGSQPAVDTSTKIEPTPAQPTAPAAAPEPKKTYRIKLVHARPSEILLYLTHGRENQGILNPAEQALYERMLRVTMAVPGGNFTGGMPLSTIGGTGVTQAVPAPVPTNLHPTGPTDQRAEDGDDQFFPGGGGGYGGGGYGSGGGFQGGFQNRPGGINQFGGGQPGANGQNGATALLPEGMTGGDVLAYDLDNSLIVRATGPQFDELQRVINFLDVAPRQLMIRAEFVSAQTQDTRTFGINWQLARGSLQAGNTGSATPFATGDVFVNYASGNLATQLRASINQSNGRVIQAPMVTTTNNVPVQFATQTIFPIITTGVVLGGNGQAVTVPNIQQYPITTSLSVWARINGDNTITLTISPQSTAELGTVTNPSGGDIPITSTQYITVTRRIADGETMVVGGQIQKNDTTSTRKVPLLGDLPIVGSLFQSRTTSVNDTELLIFVTASIIPEPTSSAGGAVSLGGGGETPSIPTP